MVKGFRAAAFAAAALVSVVTASAQVVTYPSVPGVPQSSTYSLTVNGQSVPVQKYGPISFARFAFGGSVNVTVSVNQSVSSYTLSPKSAGIGASVNGNNISFSLSSPRRLVLRKVNGLSEELFILPDALESNPPQPGAAGVTTATSVGVDNSGNTNASPKLQTAINTIGAAGGGTLYLPAGVYRIEQALLMKSYVNLYLAPGAVLQVPVNVPCCLQNQSVITLSDLTGAKVSGRGVIYGNGSNNTAITSQFHMIYTENIDNSTIEDITILDPGITGMRLVDARNTTVRGVKIMAINPNGLSDGIDVDSSQNITIDDAFIYSSDDNTSLGGGTGVRKTVKDITGLVVQNSVLYNQRTGANFKIGTTDPQPSIANLTYQNIDVIRTVQVAAFYPTQGANIDTIYLRNIRVEDVTDRILEFMIIVPSWETWNGRLGYIHNIYLENVAVENGGVRNSQFQGYDATRNINNVVFTNYQIGGQSILSPSAARVDVYPYVSGLSFPSGGLAAGTWSLSSLTPTYSANGWGSYERNLSNGEAGAGDGRTITLRGTPYASGLGVHAASELRYTLGGSCSTFSAVVGVDDEVGGNGSVNFQVWLDGVQAYDSGVLRGGGALGNPSLNVSGKNELKLIVTNGGDNIDYDHADWANAKVVCGSIPPLTVTAVTPAAGAVNVSTRTSVTATFSGDIVSTPLGSAFTLTEQGSSTPVNATVSYNSGNFTATLTPTSPLKAGTVYTATVRNTVSSLLGALLGTTKSWSFTVTSSAAPPPGVSALSSLNPTYAANGWGPYERNMSNGEQGTGDGRMISIRNSKYASGLGVHAGSDLRFALGGSCTQFTALAGVDDEVGKNGSVVFQVWLDGVQAYGSSILKGGGSTASVSVNLTGKQELRLIVTNAGDNANYDHADWAAAQIVCQ